MRAILLLALVSACSDPVSEGSDFCAGVDCSGHGTCAALGELATCVCDQGYRNDGPAVCVAATVICQSTADCDDDDPCTDDLCAGDGLCVRSFSTGTCDDGLWCNGADTCDGRGNCVHSGDPCLGACNENCDEVGDACSDPSPDTTPCDDGLFCTVGATCQSGVCTGHQARDCSAVADGCNSSTCDEAQGACVKVPRDDGESCPGGTDCVEALCAGGLCVLDANALIGEACTLTAADDGRCVAAGSSAACLLELGQPCNLDAQCADGWCTCVDAACSARGCGSGDCPCEFDFNSDGTCDGSLTRGVYDTCASGLACAGDGACLADLGDACVVNDQCVSGECTCADESCTARMCHSTGCSVCQYVTTGTGTCQTTPAGNEGERCLAPWGCLANRVCEPVGCPGNLLFVGPNQRFVTVAGAYAAAEDGDSIIIMPGSHDAREFTNIGTFLDKDVDMVGATGDPRDVILNANIGSLDWLPVHMEMMAPESVTPGFYHLTLQRDNQTAHAYMEVWGKADPADGVLTLENVRFVAAISNMYVVMVRGSSPTIALWDVDFSSGNPYVVVGADSDSIEAIFDLDTVLMENWSSSGSPFGSSGGITFVSTTWGTDPLLYGTSQYNTDYPTFPCGWPLPWEP